MATAELKFPFARELQEQHDAVRAAICWFLAEAEREGPRGRASGGEAREFLLVLCEHLIRHFEFEELNGFGGGASLHDPEIQCWIQELVRQHRVFEERLGALLMRLEESASDQGIPAPLLTELGVFFGDLRRHDVEENALLSWISRGAPDPSRDLDGP